MSKLTEVCKKLKVDFAVDNEAKIFIDSVFEELHKDSYYLIKIQDSSSYVTIKKKDMVFKKQVVFALLDLLQLLYQSSKKNFANSEDKNWNTQYQISYILRIILEAIVRSKLDLQEDELLHLLEKSFADKVAVSSSMPHSYILKQAKYFIDKNQQSEILQKILQSICKSNSKYLHGIYNKKDKDKLRLMANEFLHKLGGDSHKSHPVILWPKKHIRKFQEPVRPIRPLAMPVSLFLLIVKI